MRINIQSFTSHLPILLPFIVYFSRNLSLNEKLLSIIQINLWIV